jgi:SHS2 domain-containing protein
MKKFEQLDISGDVGLKIRGSGLEDLFKNAASGLFGLITDVSKIEGSEDKKVILNSESYDNLLIQWLNELVFLFDTYGFIGKKYSIKIDTENCADLFSLKAAVSGGVFNSEINESRLLIKAATYHNLSLKKINSQWEALVVFDI